MTTWIFVATISIWRKTYPISRMFWDCGPAWLFNTSGDGFCKFTANGNVWLLPSEKNSMYYLLRKRYREESRWIENASPLADSFPSPQNKRSSLSIKTSLDTFVTHGHAWKHQQQQGRRGQTQPLIIIKRTRILLSGRRSGAVRFRNTHSLWVVPF